MEIAMKEHINVEFASAGLIAGEYKLFQRPVSQAYKVRDVLQRHQTVHEKDASEGRKAPRRTRERAAEACDACATAKLSCDNERPCQVRTLRL